jgi:excisionase family DNA binding protein
MKTPLSATSEKKNELIPLLTVKDAIAYLQCTRRFLERMVRSGRLRALKPTPKFLRFRKADLDAFMEAGETIRA